MINDLAVANERIKELETEVAKVRWKYSKSLTREYDKTIDAADAMQIELEIADHSGERLIRHLLWLADKHDDLQKKYDALVVNTNHKSGFRLLDDNDGHYYLVPNDSIAEFDIAVNGEQDPAGIDGVVYINGPVSKVLIHDFSI